MYLIYVDESGDFGLNTSRSDYLALSGVVIHESRWGEYLDRLVDFRKQIWKDYGLSYKEEIHSARLITKPGKYSRIKKYRRLEIIRRFTDIIASFNGLNIINVVVDKTNKAITYNVFDNAWAVLIQRFENTIGYNNFPDHHGVDNCGLIICDNTSNKKLRSLLRKMRRYNPIPNKKNYGTGYRDLKLNYIIEDPNFRDSRYSYFVQVADLAAFLVYQFHKPNTYMKNTGGKAYFKRLDRILCKYASYGNKYGIVNL